MIFDLQFLQGLFSAYNNSPTASGLYMGLYFAVLIYVALKGSDTLKDAFLWPLLFLLLTVFNPFAIRLIDSVGEKGTFYRFFWILPVIPAVAYMVINVICSQVKIRGKIGVLLLMLPVIAICGAPVNDSVSPGILNSYKYPPEYMDLTQIVRSDYESRRGDDFALVAAPQGPDLQLRLYDAGLNVAWDRYGASPGFEAIYGVCNGIPETDMDAFFDALNKTNTDYIILGNQNPYMSALTDAGLPVAGKTPGYTVYSTHR